MNAIEMFENAIGSWGVSMEQDLSPDATLRGNKQYHLLFKGVQLKVP